MAIESYALISLDDVKTLLGITDDSEDASLTLLINNASDIIESYCNDRRFASTVHTNEEYDGTGTGHLALKDYPVTTLTQVDRRSGDFKTPGWDSIEEEHIKLLDNGTDGPGQVYYSGGFSKGIRNYRVTYTAGYATIPHDLQLACLQIVAWLRNRIKSTGMKSETLGEYSYTKSDEEKNLKQLGLDEVLDKYRTPVV